MTKNSRGTMVDLNIHEFEKIDQNVDEKLLKAERLAAYSKERLTAESVFENVRKSIKES